MTRARCSPASTRRRSTAARACTSSTWPASSPAGGRDRPRWGADREAPRRPRLPAVGRARPAPRRTSPRCRPCRSTWRWRRASRAPSVVHSHTWYANFAGHLAKLLYGIPHVATVHSLEPLRPWKAEQLGGGYALSSFCERTALEAADAIIAVSEGMRRDMLACYPAVDPERVRGDLQRHRHRRVPARPAAPTCWSATASTRARPSVVFVGPHHPPEGRRRTCCDAALHVRPGARSSSSAPGAPGHAGDRRRGRAAGVERLRAAARRRDLDRPDAPQARGHPAPRPRDRLRLPVHLRAAGHRQPRGDGVRGRRRRDGDGRDRRGRRRRRDRPARALRARGRRLASSRSTRRASPPASPSASTR